MVLSSADAFARLRISNPVTLFDSQLQYDLDPLLWETITAGGGSASLNANESSCVMSVAANNDSCARQTHGYFRYQPGKSQLILCTFNLEASVANVRKRVGYFGNRNGVYLEQNGSSVGIGLRTYVSGSAVDTVVPQSQWNLDKFDGSGPGGKVLDLSKVQILVIDLQWLGVGRVRVGFQLDGQMLYAHQFLAANVITTVYMTTANLPIRYEIAAIGEISGTKSMKQICCSVISEGGFETERGHPFVASNGITSVSVTTRRPVLSIRPKLTFNSQINRGQIIMQAHDCIIGSGSGYWELVYNGTLGSTPAFNSVDANSIVEFDVASTTITGGTVMDAGFMSGGANISSRVQDTINLFLRVAVTLNAAGDTADRLSLVWTSFTGSISVNSAMSWLEIR